MPAMIKTLAAPFLGVSAILVASCATAPAAAPGKWETKVTKINPETLDSMSYAAITLQGDQGQLVATPEQLRFYPQPGSNQVIDMRVRVDDNAVYERFVCGGRDAVVPVYYCSTDAMGDADPKTIIAEMKAGQSMLVSYVEIAGRKSKKATEVTLDGFSAALPDCAKVKCLNGNWHPGE